MECHVPPLRGLSRRTSRRRGAEGKRSVPGRRSLLARRAAARRDGREIHPLKAALIQGSMVCLRSTRTCSQGLRAGVGTSVSDRFVRAWHAAV